MPGERELKLRQLKSKNNRVKSSYLHLCDCNMGRARALATFTVPAMTTKQDQLIFVKEIKNYFAKRLQNLKIDVQYFMVIELGQYRSNPHLHIQLFYEKENYSRILKAYNKTIENFSLVEKRCKLVEEVEEVLQHSSSFNYIIKEFDNTKLSNNEILNLDTARKRLKQGNAKNIQFFSKSRSPHPHTLYRSLWFKHKIKFVGVNALMSNYASRLQGLKLLNARQTNKLPYFLFKNGAIKINALKLYNLILLTLLYMGTIRYSSEKCIYYNKCKVKLNFRVKKVRFVRME